MNIVYFKLGRLLQRIGELIQVPGNRLEWYGRGLWEKNCNCNNCKRRYK